MADCAVSVNVLDSEIALNRNHLVRNVDRASFFRLIWTFIDFLMQLAQLGRLGQAMPLRIAIRIINTQR
jgi:hypothetical protein